MTFAVFVHRFQTTGAPVTLSAPLVEAVEALEAGRA
jgi:hypothetical protein